MEDSSTFIFENKEALSSSFDFDAEYKKLIQKQKLDKKIIDKYYKPRKSNHNSFDFNKIDICSYKNIKDNQHIFDTDIQSFSPVISSVIRNNIDYILYVPVDSDMRQEHILRCYLKHYKTGFLIPIMLSDNTKFNNHIEYNISNPAYNELCCYLSMHIDDIISIKNGTYKTNILHIDTRLISCQTIFDFDINESFKLDSSETLLTRCIWIDTGRTIEHAPRIKFQHNLQYTNAREWASVSVDDGEPVFNLKNKDNRLSNKDIDQIKSFVRYNKQLIIDISKDLIFEDDFRNQMIKIDKYGKPITNNKVNEFDEKLYTIRYLSDNIILVKRLSDSRYNVYIDEKYLFDEWFIDIDFQSSYKRFKVIDADYNKMLFDIDGKMIHKF